MAFENENLFLAAVEKYKRGWPGDTTLQAAIRIYDTFFEKSSPSAIDLSAIERSALFEAIAKYRQATRERAALGFFQRLTTSETVGADPRLFDAASKEVTRNFRLSAVQRATLEMLRQNAHNWKAAHRIKAETLVTTHRLTVDQVVEHVRTSEMTINFDAYTFFSGKFDPGDRYLQMWERGSTVATSPYAAKRDVTEQAIFAYGSSVAASDRPYYAGINIGRRVQGSAATSSYGYSYFVLKEEVKERSTFTPSDTFNISSYTITAEAIGKLRGKIPSPVLEQLDRIKDPIRKYKAPEFEHLLMTELAIDDIRVVAAINEVTRKEGVEWKKVATFDRLERIVRWLSDQQMIAIAEISRDPRTINRPVTDYLEAQIHGPINFSLDVKEMRIAHWEVEGNGACIANMERFALKHGLPVKYFTAHELDRSRLKG